MPVPDSTLNQIQIKIRRLTRTPSTAQLSDADLLQYINTFVVYDFPEHLRTFNLRQQFTFVCNPFQDTYNTGTDDLANVTTNSLYNFQNLYISVHPPVYIAGYQSFYTQSPEQMFGIYPNINNIQQVGTGDGVSTTFTGTIPIQTPSGNNLGNSNGGACLLQNQVLISSIDTANIGLAMVDVPVIDTTTGFNFPQGNLYISGQQPTEPPTSILANNNVNYVTGQFTVTFPTAPAFNEFVNSQTVAQNVAMPQSLMYFQDQFVLRPVPDQPYRINFEVYARPTTLLELTQSPQLEEWWQYIAYGAAKKIFEDRMDMESVALIIPEFNKQQALIQRRNIVQYTNERTATIYTEQTHFGPGNGFWGWGGGPF